MSALDPATTVVITTRPSGQGVALCRRLRRHGLIAGNLPAVRLAPMPDRDRARQSLQQAMGADKAIFTSPAAVRQAVALKPAGRWHARRLAVGSSTGRALEVASWGPVIVPRRADSEGLLALKALQLVAGETIAIVGASGGRMLLGQSLSDRGATVLRAHVYRRLPAQLDARHHRLLARPGCAVVTVTSAQAMRALAARLSAESWQHLCRGVAVASSPRLVRLASELGFSRVRRARSATDRALADAIVSLF